MKVTYCVTGTGAFCTILDGRVESTVRLLNGMKRVARDLEDLADVEQENAEAALRRAARLRAAAEHVAKQS